MPHPRKFGAHQRVLGLIADAVDGHVNMRFMGPT